MTMPGRSMAERKLKSFFKDGSTVFPSHQFGKRSIGWSRSSRHFTTAKQSQNSKNQYWRKEPQQ